MKTTKLHNWMTGLALGSLLLSCSSEPEQLEVARGASVQLVGSVAPFENTDAGATRAGETWTPPAGYVANTSIASFGTFFTQGTTASEIHRFWHSGEKWLVNIEDELPVGTHYFYGYAPFQRGAIGAIAPHPEHTDSYAKGAVLTLRGLDVVNNKDVCVIVGAKEGTDATTVTGLQTGQFACTIREGGTGNENYIFLLMEHLLAAVHFRFTLNSDYAMLRTIRLRRLELTAYSDDQHTTKLKQSVDATVTLLANETNTTPIESVTFGEPYGNDMMSTIVFEGDEKIPHGNPEEETSWTDEIGFVPAISGCYYQLRSIYDVYDKNNVTLENPDGTCIRKNCEAINYLSPYNIFHHGTLERGKSYTIQLTVNPTYLYVLSEPDLDNPKVTLE